MFLVGSRQLGFTVQSNWTVSTISIPTPQKDRKGENKQMVQIIKGNKMIDLDTLISAAILNINGI